MWLHSNPRTFELFADLRWFLNKGASDVSPLIITVAVPLVMGFLLYINEVSSVGPIFYIFALAWPSVGFWLRVTTCRSPEQAAALLSVVFWGAGLIGLLAVPLSVLNTRPLVAESFGALYGSGIALTAGSLLCLPSTQRLIYQSESIGKLALGMVVVFAVLTVAAHVASAPAHRVAGLLEGGSIHWLGAWAVITLWFCMLAVLNQNRTELISGVVAFVSLFAICILFTTANGIFLALMLDAIYFWPFVVLTTIIGEVVLIMRPAALWPRQ